VQQALSPPEETSADLLEALGALRTGQMGLLAYLSGEASKCLKANNANSAKLYLSTCDEIQNRFSQISEYLSEKFPYLEIEEILLDLEEQNERQEDDYLLIGKLDRQTGPTVLTVEDNLTIEEDLGLL